MASPNKIKGVGYNYKPFEMKAKGHNNSPIEKNFGTPLQRGIATSKGLSGGEPGKPQAKTGVGSALNYAAVGSSPAKGFWDKVKSIGKKALGVKKKVDDKLGIKDPLQKGAESMLAKDGSDHTHPEFAELQEAAAAPAAAATAPAAVEGDVDPAAQAAAMEKLKGTRMGGKFGRVQAGAAAVGGGAAETTPLEV